MKKKILELVDAINEKAALADSDMPLVKQTGEISKGKRQKYLHFILECRYFYAHHFSLYFLIRLFSGIGYSTGMSDFSAS